MDRKVWTIEAVGIKTIHFRENRTPMRIEGIPNSMFDSVYQTVLENLKNEYEDYRIGTMANMTWISLDDMVLRM